MDLAAPPEISTRKAADHRSSRPLAVARRCADGRTEAGAWLPCAWKSSGGAAKSMGVMPSR